MLKLPITFLILLLGATGASAQATHHFGLRLGGNLATTTVEGSTTTTTDNFHASYRKSPIWAGQVGLVFEVAKERWAFQPALLFSQKGTLIEGTSVGTTDTGYEQRREGRTTARYHWLEVPLNVVYTLSEKFGLQVFGGPYVAVGVGGRAATVIHNSTTDPTQPVTEPITEFTDKIEYGLSEETSSLAVLSIRGYSSRRIDTGVNFGVGYRRGPVQIQAGYGLGVINLYYSASTGYTSQSGANRVAQLTGTYFFK